MLLSQLFWKLLLACAGLNVLAALAFGWIVTGWQQEEVRQQLEQRLHDTANLLLGDFLEVAAGATPEEQRRFQERVAGVGERTGAWITVLDSSGRVLADSLHDVLDESRATESHEDRPEIVASRARGEAYEQRMSDIRGEPFVYYALRADQDEEVVGFVRAALPVDSVQAKVKGTRNAIWLIALAIALLMFVLLYWLVGHIVRPVVALNQAAMDIAAGEYRARVYVSNRDELGTLARSFNRMSGELEARMAQLRQSSQRQATVLGGMVEGVIAVDERQRVVFANRAAGRLFDFVPSTVEGRPLLEVVRNHALHEAVSNSLAMRRPQRLETEWDAAGKRIVSIQATPLPGDPCPGAVLVLHDTTELRRLESLRHDFVANVSHELKTPLSSIKAYAETLQNGAIDDRENSLRFIRRIEEQADRLHHLILDMLSLARIESEQQTLDIVPVVIRKVVDACLEDHREAAAARQIELQRATDDAEITVKADREGLREILDNLLDNAIKYTPQGGRVTIDWHAAGGSARIDMTDTGIGIAEQELPRVFERFYRVDKARSRELGGTGLGLAIVKHLAQAFDGSVGVESRKGEGSTFSVELPLA